MQAFMHSVSAGVYQGKNWRFVQSFQGGYRPIAPTWLGREPLAASSRINGMILEFA
jgi:hypothetical protein